MVPVQLGHDAEVVTVPQASQPVPHELQGAEQLGAAQLLQVSQLGAAQLLHEVWQQLLLWW